MKKILLVFLIVTGMMPAIAQNNDHAMDLVSTNRSLIGMSAADVENAIVSSTYFNKSAGTQMVYLQQSYLGIPIFNEIQVLAFKNGKLVSAAGSRIKGIEKNLSVVPAINPLTAVLTAMKQKQVPVNETLLVSPKVESTTRLNYGKAAAAFEDITAELMWVPVQGGNELKLAWQVYLVPLKTSDYWLIRVDANENKVIDETNLTVYCNFENNKAHNEDCSDYLPGLQTHSKTTDNFTGPTIVGSGNYLVIPYPAESPIHPGGTPALVTNPWNLAPGNASSLGWHNDGVTDFTTTRGNNVFAQEDRDNNNNTSGLPATSTSSPDPLNFNFTPNFAVTPTQTTPAANQQFNTTNLFYWNNIIHDLTYQYGFDEASGNFQNNNQGRGGAGSDYVIADAQDAGGTNNANFATPPDGQRPRMQMYLWSGNPQKDGDADNGVVVHEYGHGISNRLTGGPATASCVQNAENMGEGWSDYYALMYTQDWATSNLNTGFNSPRGMGTYVAGQGPSGAGIRSQRYCTNFAVNNKVYAASISSESHNRGEIWCATLWDMTWNIINQAGTINPNLFNASGIGGNTVALKLVTEGMKLQPCSPGFISGRDAILQADQLLYGGLYNCAIREAFRRRGMGDQASQGSSGSVTDQVPDFNGGVSLLLTQNGMTQVMEGQNIVYTNSVNSTCADITGYILRDTLPANVTWVSGGTYDATTRVVSFPVTQAAGAAQSYSFTVNVNSGSYFTPITLIDEPVATTSIPAEWTTTATPAANIWTVSSAASQSPPNSFFVDNLALAGDQKLETTNAITLPPGTSPRLSFSHRFNTEDGWDGGVVEISANGGPWIDLGSRMITGAYNSTLGNAPTNALSNRSAFTGTINSFMNTVINLTSYAGQNVKIRFRFGSDDNTNAPSGISGWFVDDILLDIKPVVNMRSGLFNAANIRISVSDTITVIIPGVTCANTGITTQPADVTACLGTNATFSVVATGTSPVYQWQESTNGGILYTDIPGATSATYVLTAVTAAMNNYRYRVNVTNGCPSSITSAGAVLTVSSTPAFSAQPVTVSVCPGANATFNITATGSSLTYQWQVSTDGGLTFTNVPGALNNTLTIPAVAQTMNGYQYQAVVYSCGPVGVISNPATLSVIAALTISSQPAGIAECAGNSVTYTVIAAGPGLTYQWQVSTNNGTTFTNLPGETNPSLVLNNIALSQNGNIYHVVLSGSCAGLTSAPATLSVNTSASITAQPSAVSTCTGSDAVFSVSATGSTISYQWQMSRNGGAFVNLSNTLPYSGVFTNTLRINGADVGLNANNYRVIVSGVPCGGVTSQEVSLTVHNAPDVVLAAAEYSSLTPGVSGTLYTTVSPVGSYTYQWFKNGVLLPGVLSSSYPVNIDRFGNYHVIVTDINGCTDISNFVTIKDSVTNTVFIYPNPNTGQFQVRYYSAANETPVRRVTVYDAKGARVYSKDYTITRTYDKLEVNMQNMADGIYLVELTDANGNRLATGRVLIAK